MKSPANSPSSTTPNKEMKELKRVYEQLCFFAEKAQAMERLTVIRDTLAEYHRPLTNSMRQRDFFLSSSSSSHHRNSVVSESDQEIKIQALEKEQSELEKKLTDIRNRPVQHIRPQDTAAALKSLGKRATKREVQNMMWEVDEKLDGVIDWDEFHLNFERNIRDSSGLEPANFYHMVQFLIYDHDSNGMVSIDETMNMLYARVGREQMETTITKLFGGDDGAPIKEVGHQGGEINFERYWKVVQKEQQKTLENVSSAEKNKHRSKKRST